MLKNRSSTFFKFNFVAALLFSIVSCSTSSHLKSEKNEISLPAAETKSNTGEAMGPPSPYGPQPETVSSKDSVSYGPEPFQAKAIVLVLGPGLAKGFAHAGVLRALQEEKIPVAAIVATEMGALIGALYAQANSVNAFEWALQKFKPELFQEKSGVFFQKNETLPKDLKSEIEKAFGTRSLQDLKKPIKILLVQNQSLFIASDGSVGDAVGAALTGSGYYSPAMYYSKPTTGSTAQRPYPVSEAQALNLGPVVVVDLLSHGKGSTSVGPNSSKEKMNRSFSDAEKNGEKDLNNAALVIRPDLSGVDYLDFSKKTAAIFKGKSAIKDNLKLLRPLAGLPADKLDEEKSDETH